MAYLNTEKEKKKAIQIKKKYLKHNPFKQKQGTVYRIG